MAITMAQLAVSNLDDLQIGAVDEFRKCSYFMDNIPFDNSVSPLGNGGTLTYSYVRQSTQAFAQFRELNEEYTPHEVENEKFSVDIKFLGGSYQIDEVIANLGGAVDYEAQQIAQKIKAASALFTESAFTGDSAINPNQFDGLDKTLTGSNTEFNADGAETIDLSTSAAVTSDFQKVLDILDESMRKLDGEPSFIAGNSKLIAKLAACARRASMYQTVVNDVGRRIDYYGNIPLIDLGAKAGTNDPIIPTEADGMTSLYMARFGMNGFHGVTLAGDLFKIHPTSEDKGGNVVKTGSMSFYGATVLRNSYAAGVIRNIKVA